MAEDNDRDMSGVILITGRGIGAVIATSETTRQRSRPRESGRRIASS